MTRALTCMCILPVGMGYIHDQICIHDLDLIVNELAVF